MREEGFRKKKKDKMRGAGVFKKVNGNSKRKPNRNCGI